MFIEKLAQENENFRKVVQTGKHVQMVLMSLLPNEEIGEEVHEVDQVLYIASGSGSAIKNGEKEAISQGHVVFVDAGTKHNIINDNSGEMKIVTFYAPPQHRDGTVHKTKQEAEADENDHY